MFGITRIAAVSAASLAIVTAVSAGPIAGITYTYDLSQADPGTGIFTTFHADPNSQDPTNTKLTDGNLGDDVTPSGGGAIFDNGTWSVVQNGGFGGAPQPMIDVVLPGTFLLESVEVFYLVEDPVGIYAPQPQTGIDAVTVFGAGFSEFSNNVIPIFGPGGDSGTGVIERRSIVVSLNGVSASSLSIDVRTPFTFIALGEIVVNEVPEPASFALLSAGGLLLLRRRQ